MEKKFFISRGQQGVRGPPGSKGAQGARGPQGFRGENGYPGRCGMDGIRGPVGFRGPDGFRGPPGPCGVCDECIERIGITGTTGPTGSQGIQGEQGVTGPTGPQGVIGPTLPILSSASTGNFLFAIDQEVFYNNSNEEPFMQAEMDGVVINSDSTKKWKFDNAGNFDYTVNEDEKWKLDDSGLFIKSNGKSSKLTSTELTFDTTTVTFEKISTPAITTQNESQTFIANIKPPDIDNVFFDSIGNSGSIKMKLKDKDTSIVIRGKNETNHEHWAELTPTDLLFDDIPISKVGRQGIQGEQGIKGDTGPTGPMGPFGPTLPLNTTYTCENQSTYNFLFSLNDSTTQVFNTSILSYDNNEITTTKKIIAGGGITGTIGCFDFLKCGSELDTGSLTVGGNLGVTGTITASGGVTGTTGYFSGLLIAKGGVTGTTGCFDFLKCGSELDTGSLTVGGNLGVTGTITASGITGTSANFTDLTVTGSINGPTGGSNYIFAKGSGDIYKGTNSILLTSIISDNISINSSGFTPALNGVYKLDVSIYFEFSSLSSSITTYSSVVIQINNNNNYKQTYKFHPLNSSSSGYTVVYTCIIQLTNSANNVNYTILSGSGSSIGTYSATFSLFRL